MDQLREFFAKLSFKVDDSGLKAFDKQLDEMKKKMQQAGVSATQFENKRTKTVKDEGEKRTRAVERELEKQQKARERAASISRREQESEFERARRQTEKLEAAQQKQIEKAYALRAKQQAEENRRTRQAEAAYAKKQAAEVKASEAKYRLMERDAAAQERLKARVSRSAAREEAAYLRSQEQAQAKLQAFGKVQAAAYQMRDAIERRTGLQQIAARSYDEARTRKTGLMQIAASEYDERRTRNAGVTQYRAIQMNEAMDRRLGLMQVAARREDARRAARAEADERRLTLAHIQALEEDAKRIKAASRATEQRELAERRYAKMMDEAHRMNAMFNRGLLNGMGERITPGKSLLSSSAASGISLRGLTAGGGGLGVGTALGVLGAATGLGFGVANFSHDLQEAQSQLFLFQSTFGGVEKGKSEQERFRALADKMGINYAKNAQGYAGFMAAGMPTIGYEKSLQTYQAFAEYSKVAGVRGDQFKHMMLALQQIMGKGKFQAEEVNRQLVNAAPALRPIIAQAVTGKTGPAAFAEFEKMMKSGQVTAAKFMPIVAKAVAEQARKGGALEGAEADLNSQIERLANAKRDLVEALDKAGTGEALAKVVQSLAKGLQDAAKWVDINKDKVQQVFSLFKQIGDLLYDIATNKTVQIAAGLTIVSGIVFKILESLTPMRLVCLLIASAISDWVPELKTSEDGTIAFGKALDAVQVKLVDIKKDLVEMAPIIGAVVGAYTGFQVGGIKGAGAGAAAGYVAGLGYRTAAGMGKEEGFMNKATAFLNTGSREQDGWKAWANAIPGAGPLQVAASAADVYKNRDMWGAGINAAGTAAAFGTPGGLISMLAKAVASYAGMGTTSPLAPVTNLKQEPTIGSQTNTINIYPPAGSSPEDIGKKVYAELSKQTKESANQATKGPR